MPITEQRSTPHIGEEVYRAAELTSNKDGTFTFVASDESKDSHGDIVRAASWDLKRYTSNPIVLFGHDNQNPVGVSVKTWKDGTRLMSTIKLAEEGTSPFIDTLRKLVAQKIIRSVSVGFKPTVEPLRITDKQGNWLGGFEFVGQELLEISLVSVPSNPNALSIAKSANASERDLQRLFINDQSALAQKSYEENERLITLLRLGASSHLK